MGLSAYDGELIEITEPSVFLKHILWEIYLFISFQHGALFGTPCILYNFLFNDVPFGDDTFVVLLCDRYNKIVTA